MNSRRKAENELYRTKKREKSNDHRIKQFQNSDSLGTDNRGGI